jgi:predicted thioredoxin/glutaredoxin
MKPIREMIIFVEPDCKSCERVLETAKLLQDQNFIVDLLIINRADEPDSCRKFSVMIFPAVFINGRLAFYGEFSVDDVKQFVYQSLPN